MSKSILKPLVSIPPYIYPVSGNEQTQPTPTNEARYYTVKLEVERGGFHFIYSLMTMDAITHEPLFPDQAEKQAKYLAELEGYVVIRTLSVCYDYDHEGG